MNDEVIIPVELEAKDSNVKATLDKIRRYMEGLEKRRAELIDSKNLAVTKADIGAIDKGLRGVTNTIEKMKAEYAKINEYLKATQQYENKTYAQAREESLRRQNALQEKLISEQAELAKQEEVLAAADERIRKTKEEILNEEKNYQQLQSASSTKRWATERLTKANNEILRTEHEIEESKARQRSFEQQIVNLQEKRIADGNTSRSEEEKMLALQIDTEKKKQAMLLNEQKTARANASEQIAKLNEAANIRRRINQEAEDAARNTRYDDDVVMQAENTAIRIRENIDALENQIDAEEKVTSEIQQQLDDGAKLDDIYKRVALSAEAKAAAEGKYHNQFNKVTADARQMTDADANFEQANKDATADLQRMEQRYSGILGKLRQIYDVSKEKVEIERNAISTLEQQGKSVDKTATNIYKATRASKMLDHELDRILGNIKKMQSAFSTGFKGFLKTILALGTGFMSLAAGIAKTHKAQKGLNREFGFGFKTLLKYGLGIRSLYVLFNRLRSGVVDALKALALASDYVNEEISSLVTSLRFMQAAMATVVQPILKVLAPALEVLSAAFEKAAYYVSSFIATLTGQDFVFRAIRDQVDYAESLDKTAKAAKKARKELGYYDKLNVIHKDSKNGGGSGLADQMAGYKYATSPLNEAARQFAEKIKKIMKNLFRPFRKAWNSTGQVVMDKWKKALESVKALVTDIGQTFLDVWNQDETVTIFENILSILGSIGSIVDNLATKFKEAWDKNDIGRKILERARDMLGEVIGMVKYLIDETEKWSQTVDFTNMLNSLYSLLGKLDEGPLQHIISIVEHFWTAVVLPFMTYMIDKGLPLLMDTLGKISDAIDWDKLEQNMNKLSDAIGEFLPKAWEALNIVLEDFGKIIADIINSDSFAKLVDLFKNWVENTDPKEMAKDIEQVAIALVSLKAAFLGLKAITGAIITFGSFATAITNIKALFVGEKSIVVAGEKVAKAPFWSKLVVKVGELTTKFSSLAKTIAGSSATTTITGALSIVAGAFLNIFGVVKQANGEINILTVTITALGTALAAVGAVLLGAPALIAGVIAAIVFAVEEEFVLIWNFIKNVATAPEEFAESFNKATQKIGDWIDGVKAWFDSVYTTVSDFFYNLGDNIGVWLGKLAGRVHKWIKSLPEKIGIWVAKFGQETWPKIVKTLKEFPKNLGIWVSKVNWKKFGKDILDGILWVFLAPARFLVVVAQAVASFVGGLIDGFKKGFQINSPSKVMIPIGKYILQGVLKGITNAVKGIGAWIKTNVVDKFVDGIKKGFEGISQGLYDIGKNIVEGIKGGVDGNMTKVEDTAHNLCETMIDTSKKALSIKSPSRVFRQIGLYIDEGLAEGIDDGTKNATKAASNTADEVTKAADTQFDIDSVADFSDKFLGILASMSDQAVSIISAMIDSIDERLAHLTMVNSLAALNNSLSKVAMTDIPKISKGFTIPAAVAVKNAKEKDSTSEFDWNRLSDIIRDAVDEAVSNRSLDSNDPVVLMLNGKQIAKAVWDEDAKRYKQTGREGYSY